MSTTHKETRGYWPISSAVIGAVLLAIGAEADNRFVMYGGAGALSLGLMLAWDEIFRTSK